MKQKKQASIGLAIIPVLFLISFLFFATMVNNVWESGWIDVHIPLLLSAFVAGVVAIFGLNYKWAELEEGIVELIKASMGAIIILLIIGIVVGTWLAAGIVPSMVYYGLKILNPSIFLIVTLIICSVVSLATGSSWTTAATVGIALMGVGQGLNIPTPVIGGCIISGAYFGDKMSPLSDTTNLAPAVSGATLFDHIRHMIFTTGPSYIISIVFFGALGVKYAGQSGTQESVAAILDVLNTSFNINPILLLAPLLVILIVVMKIPAIPGLFGGGLIGGLFAWIFQGNDLLDIVDSMHYGYGFGLSEELATKYFEVMGTEVVDGESISIFAAKMEKLLSGGGLDGMLWTVSLILCAMIFGGIMERTGMLAAIAEGILKLAKRTGDLIVATLLTSIAMNFIAGDQYLSIVIPGRMYKDEYDRRGLHPKNLSRTLEDAATLTSPLIPWNSCGAYMIATLGLTPWTYVPYCILNLVNPLVAAFYGYTGISIAKVKTSDKASA